MTRNTMINFASIPPTGSEMKIMRYTPHLHTFLKTKTHFHAQMAVGAFVKVLVFDVNLTGSNLAYI